MSSISNTRIEAPIDRPNDARADNKCISSGNSCPTTAAVSFSQPVYKKPLLRTNPTVINTTREIQNARLGSPAGVKETGATVNGRFANYNGLNLNVNASDALTMYAHESISIMGASKHPSCVRNSPRQLGTSVVHGNRSVC